MSSIPILWPAELIIGIFLLYGPFADLLFHVWHLNTIYRGDDLKKDIALTFDDGPNPDYTPQLLDLLDEHGARALFFVVGRQAERHPELVRAIHARGHVLGIHTYSHRNAWLATPWKMAREIRKTKHILSDLTGERVLYFRPPWGRFNSFLPFQLRANSLTPVLWTIAARDWLPGDRAGEIAAIVTGQPRNGAIVLLHDNGGAPGAPRNTLAALERILPQLRRLEFRLSVAPVFEAVHATAKRRGSFARPVQRLVHPLWQLWEALFDRLYHVYALSRMFRLSVVSWHFGDRTLAAPDDAFPVPAAARFVAASGASPGTLRTGAPMAELHMQNVALQELLRIHPPEKMVVRGLREVRASLRDIALALAYDERFRDAQGVFGVTMLHRGSEKLGFIVEDIPPTFANRWVTLLLVWLMALYHPLGYRRFRTGLHEIQPRLVWMTREALIARYLPEHTGS